MNDIIGNVYGRLTVVEFIKVGKRKEYLCQCECGNVTYVRKESLVRGRTKSCGCLHREKSAERMRAKKKFNDYIISGEYIFMKASNTDDIIRIDAEDFKIINNYCWYVGDDGYARTNYKNKKTLLMHKLITKTDNTQIVDHITFYKDISKRLNNTKKNLRIATTSQNSINRKIASNNTSSVPGVGWKKRDKKWRAYIGINKKQYDLGSFEKFEDAVKARLDAEDLLFQQYSYNNSNKIKN